ncbi:peptidoglycan DD-metalloendopeptidase family protein [Pectinatus frisingensis]|uniref:peptidoglycan DD-metalloendopeptidase family protein n=1 Tax=Pectinatus frisingensis TaxID=865 RepID=UPI0018C6A89D|nr:peptidoglycan DD-metalloendopeptidase family protein [Pectinatus frisingensis]
MVKKLSICFIFIISLFLYTTAFAADGGEFDGNMISPIDLSEGEITSGFYDPRADHWEGIHGGIDIAAPEGTPIYAAADGIVSFAGPCDGFGNAIFIDHGYMDGYGEIYTVYGHMSEDSILVWSGDAVTQDEPIAFVGNEGHSTGAHLHFGVQLGMQSGAAKLDPGLFIADFANGAIKDHTPMDDEGLTMTFDSSYDFAKPIRDAINTFGDACTKALQILKDYMNKLLVILITIDFSLGAMTLTIDSSKANKIFSWLVYKMIFYGILVFLLLNWGTVVANMSRDFFSAVGGIAVGSTQVQAAQAVSDPSAIIQKGAHIVAPIFSEIAKFHGMTDLITKFGLIAPCFIFAIVLMGGFTIIGIQIAMAYIEFYMVVLFGFTSFMFAGTKQTRRYANNGFNGIFAASIKLLFFCMFSLLLQNTMQNLTTDSFFSQRVPAKTIADKSTTGGAIGSIDELMAKIRVVESQGSGGYQADNGSHYGAYQIDYDNWNHWCDMYIDAGGTLDQEPSYPPDPSDSEYAWTPENQDDVARFILSGYYSTYGSYEAAAKAWNQGEGGMDNSDAEEYWEKVSGVTVTGAAHNSKIPVTVINFLVLFKLTLVLLMFIFMGSKISKTIMHTFGGSGFFLGNEHEG